MIITRAVFMAIVSFCFLMKHDYMSSEKWKITTLSYHHVCDEGDTLLLQGQPAESEVDILFKCKLIFEEA